MPKLKRPSLGTVLGFTALVIAIGGTAHAATSHPTKTIIVRKGEIAKGAVTAKALAPGAVHAIAIAEGAVHRKALAPNAVGPASLASGSVQAGAIAAGAVGSSQIAPDAVTAGAIAPGSVYGGALGPVTLHSAPIADLDETADLSNWTASDTATAICGAGEHVLTGGVVFTNPGNRRVGIIESLPFTNGTTSGYAARITSDSGGLAAAEVQAICLK